MAGPDGANGTSRAGSATGAGPRVSRAAKRLMSELVDDGVALDAEGDLLQLLLDELDYARRPPQFERRIPLYGSIVVPDDRALVAVGELVDLVDMHDLPLAVARRFADGRAAFLARGLDGSTRLACFRRNVQNEADMVEIQDDTGAHLVQRTPVLGVTRLFTPSTTVEWTGYRWTSRPNARTQHARLAHLLPDVPTAVLGGVLELAVHWLSPGRAGATLVLPGDGGEAGLDLDHSIAAPPLSVTTRHHYPALLAALHQTDLAAIIGADGRVRRIGVGLHTSPTADRTVDSPRGMRHRSAARYTYDQPAAVAVVVSEDGPVTVFHRGRPVSECAAGMIPVAVAAGDGDRR
ncbi:MAG TPA: DNA integrity scanning protein DisA nucleotide-binding domain protein [Acidimicrobiales bacterium]|nr:DNA integrity scanning protein DisA nucleotide-binding domain protein [Acidimicrobiales bacterium]